jgi:flagellar basal body-associated protein FliL
MAEDAGTKKTLQIILIAVVASLVISLLSGGATLFFLMNRAAQPKQKVIEPRPELGKMEKMGEFVVNLADTEEAHFVRATMELEQNYGSSPEFGNEIMNRKSQLRDVVIQVLSSKVAKELKTPEGKEALKQEIKERVNSVLSRGQIARTYFTEFAVQ